MRLLKLPNAHFQSVTYTGPQTLLTIDTLFTPYVIRLWDLAHGSEPAELAGGAERYLTWHLFRSGGARYLRVQGAWSEGELLPTPDRAEEIQRRLTVKGQPTWHSFAFGPDGASVLFRHAGIINNEYRTHFHLKDAQGEVYSLYQAWGMFTPSANFSPNGRLAAMSNGMRIVSVWGVVEHRELFQLEQSDKTNALAFVSNDHLVVAAGRSVRLWDVTTGRSISKFRAFRKFADAVAVSHDRKLFAAGSRDGIVRIWDSATGREVKEYGWGVGEVRELAFSPDGATAAAAGVMAVAVWDLD